ncbi:MAG: hypothetical protein M3Q47_17890 [Actinomycetota bacterium]|nr:hypothetical protein [Actinomycetota bacterium]
MNRPEPGGGTEATESWSSASTARHSLAAAETPREAYAVVNEFTGLSAQAAENYAAVYGGHPGNVDYTDRVERWLMDAMYGSQLDGSVYGPPAE